MAQGEMEDRATADRAAHYHRFVEFKRVTNGEHGSHVAVVVSS